MQVYAIGGIITSVISREFHHDTRKYCILSEQMSRFSYAGCPHHLISLGKKVSTEVKNEKKKMYCFDYQNAGVQRLVKYNSFIDSFIVFTCVLLFEVIGAGASPIKPMRHYNIPKVL